MMFMFMDLKMVGHTQCLSVFLNYVIQRMWGLELDSLYIVGVHR